MSVTEDILNKLYYTDKNYGGLDQLYDKAKLVDKKITKTKVKVFLDQQKAYQQTKKVVGKKIFLPIYAETPYSFQIDLTFFPRYKTYNDNNYVLFTAIDINTRFAYAYYSKNKEMETILGFLKEMEKKTEINSISIDEGTEFNNNQFKKFCSDNNISMYFIKDDSHKLGIINRFHRTIKDKLTAHIIATDSLRWIDVIDQIVYNYNHSINRGIGIEPFNVNNSIANSIINEKKQLTEQIKQINDPENNKFKIGDHVRIERKKKTFQDKMLSKYSDDVYEITDITNNKLQVMDHNKKILLVKKSDVIIVKPSAIELLPKASIVLKASKESRIIKLNKKDDVIKSNIIEREKRITKKPLRLLF
jgi:hypothetical protein